MSLATYSLLAFLAGMTLNFMPCVLPVMPFKIQAILRTTDGSRAARLRAAAALLAGSLLFFTVLGGFSAALGLMWGQLFQYAGLRALMSLFFFASAVATFTGWSPRLPRAVQRLPMGKDLGAFLSGALAGILATPCAGPFLGAVLAFAATRPAIESMALFGLIGSGLAAPLMVLVVWPGLMRRFTFSGRLAMGLKALLGLLLLAAGLFYAQDLLPAAVGQAAWMALAIGAGTLLVFRLSAGKASRLRPFFVLALATLAITGFQNLPWSRNNIEIAWQPYTESAFRAAAGRPVLVYFSADWCINCRTMAHTTFSDGKLRAHIASLDVTPLKVDLTRADGDRRAIFDRFGGHAIPYVVVLDRTGRIVQRYTGVVDTGTLMDSLNPPAQG